MPGLPEQVVELNFAKGLGQHEDEWLKAEGFLQLENCIQEKGGAVVKAPSWDNIAATSIQYRLEDFTSLSAMPERPKLIRLGKHVGAVAAGHVFSLRSDNTWVLQGRASPWVLEQRTIVDVAPRPGSDETYTYEATRHDCCRCNDYVYSVYEYWAPDDYAGLTSRLAVVVTHLPTGKTIVQEATDHQTYSLTHPRIVQWGTTDRACLIYRREAETPENYADLYFRQIDGEAITGAIIGAEQPLVISGSTPISADCFDAVVDSDLSGAYLWVAYHPSSGVSETVTSVHVYRWTFSVDDLGASASHGHTETGLSGVPRAVALSVRLSADRVCVAYSQTRTTTGDNRVEDVRVFKREADLTAFGGFANQALFTSQEFDVADELNVLARIRLITVVDSGTSMQNAVLFYDPNFANKGGEFDITSGVTRGYSVTNPGHGDEFTACRLRLRGKAFWDGVNVCALMEHVSGQLATPIADENRYYVVMGYPGIPSAPAGRMFPLAHFAQTTAVAVQCIAQTDEPGLDFVTAVWTTDDGAFGLHALERDPGTLRLRLRAYELHADDRVGRAAEFGGAAYLAGALLSQWDGLRSCEGGWIAFPHIESSFLTVATPNQGDGTRYYRLTFARVNAAGELLRSKPSSVVQVTAAAGERVDLEISPFCTSLVDAGDLQSLWVEVWRTLDGQASPFYLVAREPLDLTNREVVTWGDEVSDANAPVIFEQSLAYDDQLGNELPNDAPPPATHVAVHRNRLWLTDGEQLAYSKEQSASRQAEFSLVQTVPAPASVAIAPLGDVLAVFKARGTGYVYGEGAAANGAGATLVGPVELQTEHGCTAPACVCVIPDGVLVRTERGLQVLNLQRQYVPVGLAVEDTLADYPVARDAEWECGTARVWVALSEDDTSPAGLFVVWDLEAETWSVIRYSQQGGLAPSSVRSTDEALRWVTYSGLGRVPSATPGMVSTTHFNQLITTPWLKPGGALAEVRVRRVWLLGENQGTSPLAVDVGYDFDDEWTHTASFDEHHVASETEVSFSWDTGAGTPAAVDEVLLVATVDDGGTVPHAVSATVDVEMSALGSYPLTVTAAIRLGSDIVLTGDSQVFSSVSETHVLTVAGSVRPTQGADIEFVLLIQGSGVPSGLVTELLLDEGALTVEAEDALSNPMMLRVATPKQRCHAVRFRIRENILSGSGSAGFRFVAMRVLTALRGAKGPLKGTANAGSGFVSNGGE